MSAAKEFMNSKLFDKLIMGIISLMVGLAIYNIQRGDERMDTISKTVETKASKQELKEAIIRHEEKEMEMFKPMKQDISDIKNYLFYQKLPEKR